MRYLLALSAIVGLAACGHAQYQATIVNSSGFENAAYPYGISNGRIAGYGWSPTDGSQHGLYWPSATQPPVLLGTGAFALNIAGPYQVGYFQHPSGYQHASLWTGSEASRVSLHPNIEGAYNSVVWGANGNDQVGYVNFAFPSLLGTVPALWHGTAESFVNLLPADYNGGFANGAGPGMQVGQVFNPDITTHAVLWRGSAESMVNLHPSYPEITGSTGWATDGIQQCGFAYFGNIMKAALWEGTPESFKLLHPGNNFVDSWAFAVRNGKQAGYVGKIEEDFSYRYLAALWTGTAESYVSLHQFLPPVYTDSYVTGIDTNGDIAGYAWGYLPDGSYIQDVVIWKVAAPPLVLSSFFQPLNDPATPESVSKRGSTIPLKIRLSTSTGDNSPNQVITVSLVKIGTAETAVNEADYYHPSDIGNTFKYDPESALYTYHLNTKNLQAGARYRVTATVQNGPSHSVTFSLR